VALAVEKVMVSDPANMMAVIKCKQQSLLGLWFKQAYCASLLFLMLYVIGVIRLVRFFPEWLSCGHDQSIGLFPGSFLER
jgi:hypothetical protein